MASDAPIFIVCAPRSGSTLLREILNRHPLLHLTRESHFWAETSSGRWCGSSMWRYFGCPPFGWLRLSPEAVLQRMSSHAVPSREEAFYSIMRVDAARHGKVRFGDKTPMHILCVADLLQAFPGARVVHLVRDPRDVVASLARMPWASSSHLMNALLVSFSVRQALAADAEAGGRLLHVKYEDLLASPEDTLRLLLEHIGLPWHSSLLDPSPDMAQGPDAMPAADTDVPWLLQARGPILPPTPVDADQSKPRTSSAASAGARLTHAIEVAVETICAHEFTRFGYVRRSSRWALAWPTTLMAILPE